MEPRSVGRSIAAMLVTLALGLALRLAPLGLPRFLVKYGGSTMWAAMIYWVMSTAMPRWRVILTTIVSGLIATAVEFFKLYHSPAMDSFRLTLPGMLLLGRIFSVWDIAAYWIAILAVAVVDAKVLRRQGSV